MSLIDEAYLCYDLHPFPISSQPYASLICTIPCLDPDSMNVTSFISRMALDMQ